MVNLELNEQEKIELEKRGFFVKRNYSLDDYITHIQNLIMLFSVFVIPVFILCIIAFTIMVSIFPSIESTNGLSIFTLLTIGITTIYILWEYISFYSKTGVSFFTTNGSIKYGEFDSTKIKIPKILKLFPIQAKIQPNIDNLSEIITGKFIFYYLIPSILFIFLPISLYTDNQNDAITLGVKLIYLYISIFSIFSISLFIFQKIYQSMSPLYKFGNLGEKIQKLTPQIEEKSKQIQSEFQSDMNFSILSDGFDSLSSTFSDIALLVVELEKAETIANKGNLFDSEKYISSLRSDIVTPLTSLKLFFETQKMELTKSEKELTRVRVGGSESTENIELQSKRSESLVHELTENIEKLDVMIGKMGK